MVVECLFDCYAVFSHSIDGVFVCVDVSDVVEFSAGESLFVYVESLFAFSELPG